MKELTLRPYPGKILICKSKKEYRREHIRLFGESIDLKYKYGRMDGRMDGCGKTATYLVWGCDTPRLAHELSHVILSVFELIGIDPKLSAGEPFCYLLSQLLLDAGVR